MSTPSLLTRFHPSPACLTDHYRLNFTTVGSQIYQYDRLGPGPRESSDCLPPGYTASGGFYSPGVCPSGYTQACSNVVSLGSNTETRATCCPSKYVCQSSSDWWWYSTLQCTLTQNGRADTFTVTSTESLNNVKTITAVQDGGYNAYAIEIRFMSTDFVSTTSLPTSSPTTTSPSTTTTPPSPSTTSSSLPAAVIAGITIAVLAAVASVLGFAYWLRKSEPGRKRRRLLAAELGGGQGLGGYKVVGAGDRWGGEMDGGSQAVELQSGVLAHEIEGRERPVEIGGGMGGGIGGSDTSTAYDGYDGGRGRG